MKYIVFSFLGLFAFTNVSWASEYQSQIEKCDREFDKLDAVAQSTIDIVRGMDTQIECYKEIVYSIIDAKYSQNADSMKENFFEYIDAKGDAVGLTRRPDSCYPQSCGTLVSIESASARRDAAREYLDMLTTPPEIY